MPMTKVLAYTIAITWLPLFVGVIVYALEDWKGAVKAYIFFQTLYLLILAGVVSFGYLLHI